MKDYYISDSAKEALSLLAESGYEAYIVGGSVRDNLLGVIPSDFDLTTDARPEEILEIFKDFKTVEVGRDYGTIGVLIDKEMIEITTYRTESSYSDGRRPDTVEYARNLKEDLSRRDFTINAMAMDIDYNIVDYYGGREDLESGIIRTVGDPRVRFDEDKLRMLRAIRFATRLSFGIEEDTRAAIVELSDQIKTISKERICDELTGIMLTDKPSLGLLMMVELGLMEEIIPELMVTVGYDQMSPYHHRSLFKHKICVVDNVEPKLHLRLAALFHDIAKPETLFIDEESKGRFFGHDKIGAKNTTKILKRLGFDRRTIKKVEILIADHMKADPSMKRKGLKRQIKRVGEDLIYDLLDLMIADMHCTRDDRDDRFLRDRIEEVDDILESKEPVDASGLEIDGNVLIKELELEPGPVIGMLLDYLTEKVIDDPSLNVQDTLIQLAKKKVRDYD